MNNGDTNLNKELIIGTSLLEAERDAKIKALDELIEKAKENARHYKKIKTKVYKGKLAHNGSLFFGVIVKDKRMTYKNVVLVNCKGKDDETEQLLYNELFMSLCKKYELNIQEKTVEDIKTDVEEKANRLIL